MDKQQTTELEQVVIRFSGDSGDGMQLVGTMFSNISAILGNEISTFPDYPAEIRAPQGTVGGVSGFQVHLGAGSIHTPGDDADILVAMNPAALKVNAKGVKRGGVIIFDTDSFTASDLEKAVFTTDNPFEELDLSDTIQLIPVALSELTKESLKDSGLDNKSILRSKNMFALGLICWLFNRPMEQAIHFLENKFKRKPGVLEANVKVLTDGYNYGNNAHLSVSRFVIDKSHDVQSGRYTSIAGNTSAAYGLIAAAGDRHLAEFMPGNEYLNDPETVASWKFGLTTVDWRKADLQNRLAKSHRLLAGEEEVELKPTGEEGILLIKALCGLGRVVSNVNVPNTALQIPNLPAEAVVETNALFERDAIRPVMAGSLPEEVRQLILPHVRNHERILKAALTCDRELVVQAFLDDPLVKGKGCSERDVRLLIDDMIEGTKRYLPEGWK